MANENKNVNELVSTDDDPTAELEALTFKPHYGIDENIEADAQTFDAVNKAASNERDSSAPELESGLRSQTKTIDRLQFDIEQLHAKWLGLEAEIKARESQTIQLNEQLNEQASTLDQKEHVLQEREQEIDSLESATKQKDEEYQALLYEFDEVQRSLQTAEGESDDAISRISAEHAASTDQLNEQLSEQANAIDKSENLAKKYERKIESLESAISQKNEEYQTVRHELDEVRQSKQQVKDDSDKASRELSAQHAASIDQLDKQLTEQANTIDGKDNLLEENRQDIESLESAVTQKGEEHQTLLQDLENVRQSMRKAQDDSEKATRQITTEHAALTETAIVAERVEAELRHKLHRSDEYGDTIRRKLQDRITSSDHLESERDRLADFFANATQEKEALAEELRDTKNRNQKIEARLDSIKRDHKDEIGILRFELGEAQNTATESEVLSAQLATDLAAARGSRDNLEQSLNDAEKRTKTRIEGLQEEIKELRHAADDYEVNLKTKSEAITSLLAELAKKSSQLESIGKIEDVIQDIDDRMSERFAVHKGGDRDSGADLENKQNNGQAERVTRVMVGTIDNQVLRFPIFKDHMTIGRTEDNDIHLRAAYVSRRHAVVQSEGDGTRIIDLDSKNGIYVNSERVSEHILGQGDIVTIGNARFRYEELKKRDF